MTTAGPITTPEAFQLGYDLALRDLEHTIETLIELVADVLEHVDSDTVYHSTKDHVEAYNAATNALTSKDDAV